MQDSARPHLNAREIFSARRSAWPILMGIAACLCASAAFVPGADAKSPGSRYCFHDRCYRVGTLAQTSSLVGWRGHVLASFYDSCSRDRLNPCGLTSSGAVFRPDRPDNAASPLLPDGTVILAYNPKTGDASILRVTNAGPYSGERKLDVSRAAADKLGFREQGVATLVITVLQAPTQDEASYVKRREYPSVPGHLGKFDNVDQALEVANQRFDVRDEGDGVVDLLRGKQDTEEENDPRVPKPQLAVSPSLAREMTILRLPPRPVTRSVRLIQEPRLVTRADVLAQRSRAPDSFASYSAAPLPKAAP